MVSGGLSAFSGLSVAFSAGFSTTTAFSAAAFFSSSAFSEMPLALTPDAGMPAISASDFVFPSAVSVSDLTAPDFGWAVDTAAAFGASAGLWAALAVNLAADNALNFGLATPALGALAMAAIGMWLGQVLRMRMSHATFGRWFFIGLLLLGIYLALRAFA